MTSNDVASLLRLAYLLTGDRHASQDLVQEVLLRLWEKTFDRIGDPVSYARRAVVNAYISEGRRVSRAQLALPLLMDRSAGPDWESTFVDREMVRAALHQLSPKQRAVVVLRYWADLHDRQIAHTLGCKEVTVRSLLSRARATMRPHLEEGPR